MNIQGYPDVIGGFTTFYPGENLTFAYENGTELVVPWLAIYNSISSTGPLATGGDFYNFFVLGFYPASFTPSAASTTAASTASATAAVTSTPNPTGWSDPAYPSPADVVQPDLSLFGSGVLTGYFFNDTLTGVLSIPSFDSDDEISFTNTVSEFLSRSKEAGMKKIVIDLQQNAGGNALLAFDTFKQVSIFYSFLFQS